MKKHEKKNLMVAAIAPSMGTDSFWFIITAKIPVLLKTSN
ncbi:hypothetical protein LOK49_LG11G02462 [Camellia lanceoleosa]|uniref:Uncharacterized protein n=1 Tax=Camellia lanceoleosa TaxID=1840588 RepID=A0ACC0G283_9ERIC|nr:hypothetical protein LOK49_LG11G02462 [Camellia lanceoleosa]